MSYKDIEEYARYILNHYNKDSEKDILVLTRDLSEKLKKSYDRGFDAASEVDYWPNA